MIIFLSFVVYSGFLLQARRTHFLNHFFYRHSLHSQLCKPTIFTSFLLICCLFQVFLSSFDSYVRWVLYSSSLTSEGAQWKLRTLNVPNMKRILRFHEKKRGINNVLYDEKVNNHFINNSLQKTNNVLMNIKTNY